MNKLKKVDEAFEKPVVMLTVDEFSELTRRIVADELAPIMRKMQQSSPQRPLRGQKELAEALGLSHWQVWSLQKKGIIKPEMQIGKIQTFDLKKVMQQLKDHSRS